MGNLLASLASAAESLRTFERATSITSANVTNSSTPGYVRQQPNLVAESLQIDTGLPGGVRLDGLQSARDSYLEQAVRLQSQQSSEADQRAALLQQIEPIFDISEGNGVAGALDAFQNAVSSWTISPNDYTARQNVIRSASDVAHAFNTTAQSLGVAEQEANTELTAAVTAVNRLGDVLTGLNAQIRSDARAQFDPGIDAQIHSTLEQLSQYSNFTLLRGEDGTYSVYLGGQTPFVLGDHEYNISADLSSAQPALRDAEGRDVTEQFTDGKLQALVDFRGNFITGVGADLNQLAKSFADKVNTTLSSGLDANGQPATQPLFTYSTTTGAAATLAVATITTDQLGGASVGAPSGNGNALALATTLSKPSIGSLSFTQFYGDIAGRVGRAISIAQQDQQTHHQLLAQAKSVREEKTSISLDEEAAKLIQFQRAYQATATLFKTLDEMTQDLINLKR